MASVKIQLVNTYQDGGVFYDSADNRVVANYSKFVRHDTDIVGAEIARSEFAINFPTRVRYIRQEDK